MLTKKEEESVGTIGRDNVEQLRKKPTLSIMFLTVFDLTFDDITLLSTCCLESSCNGKLLNKTIYFYV